MLLSRKLVSSTNLRVRRRIFGCLTCSFLESRLAPDLKSGLIAFVLLDATAQWRAIGKNEIRLYQFHLSVAFKGNSFHKEIN